MVILMVNYCDASCSASMSFGTIGRGTEMRYLRCPFSPACSVIIK